MRFKITDGLPNAQKHKIRSEKFGLYYFCLCRKLLKIGSYKRHIIKYNLLIIDLFDKMTLHSIMLRRGGEVAFADKSGLA